MEKRIVWLDIIKGILITLVVLGHSIGCARLQLNQQFINDYFWKLIYSFHMPAFMAVSGYVAYRNKRISADIASGLSVIFRRFRQLMIPFLLWSVALFFVRHNVEHYYDYILIPNLSLWFLWALFFISAIFILADWLSARMRSPQIVLMVVVAVLLVGLMLIVPNAKLLGIEYVSYYFIFYTLGYYMHKYELLKQISITWTIVLALLWFALAQFWEAKETPIVLRWVSFVPSIVLQTGYRAVTATVAIFALFSAVEKWGECKILSKFFTLGQISLGIYAVHMVIRFKMVDALVFLMPNINYWPLMITTFCLLLFISYCVVWLLGKWNITASWLLGKLK